MRLPVSEELRPAGDATLDEHRYRGCFMRFWSARAGGTFMAASAAAISTSACCGEASRDRVCASPRAVATASTNASFAPDARSPESAFTRCDAHTRCSKSTPAPLVDRSVAGVHFALPPHCAESFGDRLDWGTSLCNACEAIAQHCKSESAPPMPHRSGRHQDGQLRDAPAVEQTEPARRTRGTDPAAHVHHLVNCCDSVAHIALGV